MIPRWVEMRSQSLADSVRIVSVVLALDDIRGARLPCIGQKLNEDQKPCRQAHRPGGSPAPGKGGHMMVSHPQHGA